MKIDINKDFETAYQQSIWKGLDLKQLLTVFCFLPTVIGVMGVLWYFLKIPPQGACTSESWWHFRFRFSGCSNTGACPSLCYTKNGSICKQRRNCAEKQKVKPIRKEPYFP